MGTSWVHTNGGLEVDWCNLGDIQVGTSQCQSGVVASLKGEQSVCGQWAKTLLTG